MIIYRDINNLPAFNNAVITIGFFDGVHNAHRLIIQQLINESKIVKGCSVVITFSPHPRIILGNEIKSFPLLNTFDEKCHLLEDAGVDYVIVVPFTKAFSELNADEYIQSFLVKYFNPHSIIIGYDHHFGKNRVGNFMLLKQNAEKFGYVVKEIPEYIINDITISSTRIREMIMAGDIDSANKLLGYHYFFSGEVVIGNTLGRTIGFPTANLMVEKESKLIPGNGVYAVVIRIENTVTIFKGMMNIGINPTFGINERKIEVNIFDFDKDIYGQKLHITIHSRLRSEKKFDGIKELSTQLVLDKQKALLILN
jgi:riboflavin kinase/FMN adenylyltransferase